jgi:precorrin-2 C20-methyltransferase/precorrin-3B C17-methyltransferase
MHMHTRLTGRYRTEVVPGVTSVSAAAAVTGRPLVEGEEVLTVLPGTLPPEVLTERLSTTDSAAVLKLGRTFEKVRKALTDAGRLDEALYVERATWDTQRVTPLSEVDPNTVPYFSLALLPSKLAAATAAVAPSEPAAGAGEVAVVGLGPAGRPWLTPEAQETLAWADDLVGYGPYLDRVPPNPRQRRHPSGNTVEADRAALALSLARSGRRVAVVSSGDPGVFAMASAVLEVAREWPDVRVRVVPGLTAAQAVASKAGAPLGHDYCVISLSDRLKPWSAIADRLEAAARADFVIAIYNPASKTRRTQLDEAKSLLLTHRAPNTPVVVGRDVGGPTESIEIVTLADLDTSTVDMRCLLIIGSSQTRVTTHEDGTKQVFTPRHYPTS